jgi:hypothetical protein
MMANLEKHWTRTRFGDAPFREVKLYEFTFQGPKSAEECAFAQYRLLLNEDVLQAHLDFSTKKGKVVVVSKIMPIFSVKKELESLGLKCKYESEETLTYEYYLGRTNTI